MLDQILENLEELFDNQDAGFVHDYEVIESGLTQSGLTHNGHWVRIVMLDKNTVAYASQNDSFDGEFTTGPLENAAEWIVGEIEEAAELQ